MGALSAYYEREHGENPIRLETPADVDAMVDALRAQETWPLLAQVYVSDDLGKSELSAGVRGDVGVLRYAGEDAFEGLYSLGDGPADGEWILYYYVTADTPFPPNAEVPLAVVRDALVEYLESNGARPNNVEWQEKQ